MSTLKYWHEVEGHPAGGEWRYVTIPLVGTPISYVTATGGSTSILTNNSSIYMSGWTDVSGETSWVDTSTGEITVPEDGWYLIDGGFRFNSGMTSGTRLITYIVVNGSLLLGSRNEIDSGNSSTPSLNPSGQAYLSAGDKIAILVYQASGSTWEISLQGISVSRISEAPVILDNRYVRSVAKPFHEAYAVGESITSASSWQKVTWAAPSVDGGWGSGINLVAPETGAYSVSFLFVMTGGATTRAIQSISPNAGANPLTHEARHDGTSEGNHYRTISAEVWRNAGDYLNCYVWTNSSGRSINSNSRLAVTKVA